MLPGLAPPAVMLHATRANSMLMMEQVAMSMSTVGPELPAPEMLISNRISEHPRR